MGKTTFKALVAAALVGVTALTLAAPAEAGRGGYGRGGYGGYGRHYHGGDGNALGAGLIGFGIGAIVGSALTPREVYVAPPPPPPTYYAPAAYGPPPWTPDWYTYCYSRYRSFNPNTGYFIGYDGVPYFCQ
jgi:BA14K-like protein